MLSLNINIFHRYMITLNRTGRVNSFRLGCGQVPISLGAERVVAVLGDVADPGQRLVPGLLNDLQVADLPHNNVVKNSYC